MARPILQLQATEEEVLIGLIISGNIVCRQYTSGRLQRVQHLLSTVAKVVFIEKPFTEPKTEMSKADLLGGNIENRAFGSMNAKLPPQVTYLMEVEVGPPPWRS